jgi:2'-5' RNA ligase
MFGAEWWLMDVINRTFVGIPIPPEVSSQIEHAMLLLKRKPGVDNIRWNAPSELLIQLASLGELGPGTLATLRQVLPPVISRFPTFCLNVKGFAGLPTMIQPRFVYAALEGDTSVLDQIAQAVDLGVANYVPHRDMRGFRPQILLGRLKTESEPLRVALGRALRMTEAPDMGSIPVDSIDLLISQADESGIRYVPVMRMPLGAS